MTPVVIEARDLDKTFRIPGHRIESFKERAVHPFTRVEYRELRALQSVSFDVHRGEFFGIVGRNGSGKSTLLKLLASIYKADAGRIRMAGRVAPFIELGVGFNPDLTARENVVLNGVMMGLSRREAARRLDAVLEFAELEEFVELKLKNYSSGMLVRLAFSVMVQSDSDLLLIDEVLAVGDASFQRKCMAVFDEIRHSPRTVVLVTHDMGVVQSHCDRAMLLDEGQLLHIGDPEQAGRRYLQVNFERLKEADRSFEADYPDLHTRLEHASIENGGGGGVPPRLDPREPIKLTVVLEALSDLVDPRMLVFCANAENVAVFEFERDLLDSGDESRRVRAGEHVRISATIENPLQPGSYTLRSVITRRRDEGGRAVQAMKLAEFEVGGEAATAQSLVSVDADLEVSAGEDGA
jgi:ABC-2 type transport system ATP-binding protein